LEDCIIGMNGELPDGGIENAGSSSFGEPQLSFGENSRDFSQSFP
jgi:hypothetical protein